MKLRPNKWYRYRVAYEAVLEQPSCYSACSYRIERVQKCEAMCTKACKTGGYILTIRPYPTVRPVGYWCVNTKGFDLVPVARAGVKTRFYRKHERGMPDNNGTETK